MKMGFVSLLLALTEASIPNICVSKGVAKSFLPCRDIAMESSMEPVVFTSTQTLGSNSPTTLPVLNSDQTDHCESKVNNLTDFSNFLLPFKQLKQYPFGKFD